MEASIDNTKRDLHNWIMEHRGDYQHLMIKIVEDYRGLTLSSIQRQLDFLIEKKINCIRIYFEDHMHENAKGIILQEIIEINNHIKQLLGL